MKCRVIKPGFVRRKFGSKIKSVLVNPPDVIDIEGKIPAWCAAIDPVPAAPIPESKSEDKGAKGSIPSPADAPNNDEAAGIGAELEQIKGIGGELRSALVAVGIDSLSKFVQAGRDDRAGLIGLPGISEKNVDSFIAQAVKLSK